MNIDIRTPKEVAIDRVINRHNDWNEPAILGRLMMEPTVEHIELVEGRLDE